MMGRSYNTSSTQYDKDVRQSIEYKVKHSKDKVGTTSNFRAGSNKKNPKIRFMKWYNYHYTA